LKLTLFHPGEPNFHIPYLVFAHGLVAPKSDAAPMSEYTGSGLLSTLRGEQEQINKHINRIFMDLAVVMLEE
jgi:hypothetical protein